MKAQTQTVVYTPNIPGVHLVLCLLLLGLGVLQELPAILLDEATEDRRRN